jgi:hypothetical protein
MKIIKLFIGILMFLILINITKADDDSFKYNTDVDLKIPCYENERNCNSTVLCNLTIKYPNQSVLINNDKMSFNPSYFNYTIPKSKLMTFGEYNYNTVCISSINSGFTEGVFKVTKTGFFNEKNQSLLIIGIIATLTFISLIFAIKDDFTKTILLFLSLASVLILINSAYLSIVDPTLSTSLFILYKIVFWTIITLLIYVAYTIIKRLVNNFGDKEEDKDER